MRRVFGLGMSVAMLAAAMAMPAWAQGAEPEASTEQGASTEPVASEIPVTTKSGRPDLYLDMPYFVGGFEPEIVMTRGEEHWATLDADDQTRLELEGLLEEVGADVTDMVSGYALVSLEDFFAFVVAIRIDGVEPGTLTPAYLPILYDDLINPEGIAGEMGGKDIIVIASVGNEDEYVELYLYDEGDTIWMLQGPSDVVELALEKLPNALPAD
jgi:hypothetical protein